MKAGNEKNTVIISEKATEMMVAHARFLTQVSEQAAESLVLEFTTAVKSLEHFPERNPWFSDPVLPIYKYRKLLVSKRYLIIYLIKHTTVYIDLIVDCRQQYRWLL